MYKLKTTSLKYLLSTVEPRYNEPLYNEVLGITDNFLYPSNSKMYEKEPRYNVIGNKFCQSLGPSLYRGFTVVELAWLFATSGL